MTLDKFYIVGVGTAPNNLSMTLHDILNEEACRRAVRLFYADSTLKCTINIFTREDPYHGNRFPGLMCCTECFFQGINRLKACNHLSIHQSIRVNVSSYLHCLISFECEDNFYQRT